MLNIQNLMPLSALLEILVKSLPNFSTVVYWITMAFTKSWPISRVHSEDFDPVEASVSSIVLTATTEASVQARFVLELCFELCKDLEEESCLSCNWQKFEPQSFASMQQVWIGSKWYVVYRPKFQPYFYVSETSGELIRSCKDEGGESGCLDTTTMLED